MKRQEYRGEITAFLSIVFVLLLSLVGALIQSASIHISKSRNRTATQMALESYFAEYHDKMWEEYGILARETDGERQIAKRLEFYGAAIGTHEVQKMQLLSDGRGRPFLEQVIKFMGGTPENSQTVSLPNDSVNHEEEESRKALEELLNEEAQELPEENNPIYATENLKKSSLLSLIHPKPENLSENTVTLEELPSCRKLREGNFRTDDTGEVSVTDKALVVAYITGHFSAYQSDKTKEIETETKPCLEYEQEYLLQGKAGDQENLEGVAKRILGVRMAINYAHILGNTEKKAEADAMALTLTALLSVPAAKDIVKHAILLSWAYGESIVDLRVLFQGKKVPVVKTKENWQLQLANVSKLGTEQESVTEGDGSKGMDYEDYLKGFLLTEKSEKLSVRMMDLAELKTGIKVDCCVTALEIESACTLQRGVKDSFVTRYRYH